MRRYFITQDIQISRTDLINILKTALGSGVSLHWVFNYTFESKVLKLQTIDDRVYRVRREDLMSSLRSLQNIFADLAVDNEFNTRDLDFEGADLVLQIAACGQLQYD
ncbi:MAG: hypothetical protein PHT78_06675 [Desulfitobacteriaceae bacterium]|nr:hypothetical protein [Desulfitobacteriaceae bacterium]